MLKPYLHDLARRPFAWGETDCVLILADWWRLNRGVDLAADLRGTYATAEECRAVLERHGGVLRLVARRLAGAGAERTSEPDPGDIGVLRYDGKHIGGLCVGDGRWAGKSLRGVSVFPSGFVAAWKV